ncbi:ABC-type ribose transport system, auxiliary component [Sanguibacter keddieii DSM 10542]|uniref:D-ribose pyranase n=1 Tax=Sanguibacter keddieii (strain ATCC 51767 / DSM 10542 / NCFB 3025 / ST-74) TaxID=446469 RepID=D1BIP0_SANKS|nr:D-ribose pyranase [Sanguibacter keddieii]ACZ20082.1 ABC-type ribose transport system, auxiliary component [Sanguibacter keddieii DSM 10542]
MKRSGVLNPALAEGLARLGHGHLVLVVDCGTPIPPGARVVDVSVVAGVPGFTQVLDAVLDEIVVEGSVAASESAGTVVAGWLEERGLSPELVPHEDLKALLPGAALVIRTGEATAWANVGLRCGVPF